jgi:hypothetical protein
MNERVFESSPYGWRYRDCKCEHIFCVCGILETHEVECRFRLAATCAIPIACKAHGKDVCPDCGDVCSCDAPVTLGPEQKEAP